MPNKTRGRRLLFLGPKTYQYHKSILRALANTGYSPVFMGENNLDLAYRWARFAGHKALEAYLDLRWKRIDRILKSSAFDQVLVIRGEMVRPRHLEKLRKRLPRAELVMYQWDALANHAYLGLTSYFDRVVSFDRRDAETHGFRYLPLFYDYEFDVIRKDVGKREIDILMVASLRSDRVEIAREVHKKARENGLNCYIYIYIPLMTFIKKGVKRQISAYENKYVHFSPMTKERYLQLLSVSRAVFDVNDMNQAGLTMRTMETLGAGRKLLTTNEQIRQEPFFSSSQVRIIDRKDIDFEKEFIVGDEIGSDISGYRIDHWIRGLLG